MKVSQGKLKTIRFSPAFFKIWKLIRACPIIWHHFYFKKWNLHFLGRSHVMMITYRWPFISWRHSGLASVHCHQYVQKSQKITKNTSCTLGTHFHRSHMASPFFNNLSLHIIFKKLKASFLETRWYGMIPEIISAQKRSKKRLLRGSCKLFIAVKQYDAIV